MRDDNYDDDYDDSDVSRNFKNLAYVLNGALHSQLLLFLLCHVASTLKKSVAHQELKQQRFNSDDGAGDTAG